MKSLQSHIDFEGFSIEVKNCFAFKLFDFTSTSIRYKPTPSLLRPSNVLNGLFYNSYLTFLQISVLTFAGILFDSDFIIRLGYFWIMIFRLSWRLTVIFSFLLFFYFLQAPLDSIAVAIAPPANKYQKTLWELQLQQEDFQLAYDRAKNEAEKKEVIEASRQHIFDNIQDQLYPYWKGTQWAYSGTTETPRKGKIACGYFVSTILRDVGFEVERVNLARQASEKIVKTFAAEKDIQRFRHKTIKSFVNSVIAMGDGLYIVGLDTHVGMMLVENGKAQFLHSAKSLRWGIQAENPLKSKVLKKSKYRIVGKALSDEMVLKWLTGKKIKTYGL